MIITKKRKKTELE